MDFFTIFWIIVAVVLAVDFAGAIILYVLETKLKKQRPANANEVALEEKTTHVEGEKLFLQIEQGVVTIIDELPTVEVIKETQVIKRVAVPVAAGEEVAAEAEDTYEPLAEGEESEEGRVVFVATEQRKTFLDRLAELPREDYARYEAFVNYVISKSFCKQNTTNNKCIIKYKTDRLVIVTIRRGIITLEYLLTNSDLNHYMRAEKTNAIKVSRTTIRLIDDDALQRAKSLVDITITNLENDREYYKEQKKAQRREQRARAKEAAAAAATTAENGSAPQGE